MTYKIRVCDECGHSFEPRSSTQLRCSAVCTTAKKAASQAKYWAAYQASPEYKVQKAGYSAKYRARPEYKAYIAAYQAVYNANPKIKTKKAEYSRDCRRERRRSDPAYRLKHNFYDRMRKFVTRALRKEIEGGHPTEACFNLTGYTPEQMLAQLTIKMLPGMRVELIGTKQIHIDHIIPMSAFDLNDRAHLAECWHPDNLRPLWPAQNIAKGDSLEYAHLHPRAAQVLALIGSSLPK